MRTESSQAFDCQGQGNAADLYGVGGTGGATARLQLSFLLCRVGTDGETFLL